MIDKKFSKIFGSTVKTKILDALIRGGKKGYSGEELMAELPKTRLTEIKKTITVLKKYGICEVQNGFARLNPSSKEAGIIHAMYGVIVSGNDFTFRDRITPYWSKKRIGFSMALLTILILTTYFGLQQIY